MNPLCWLANVLKLTVAVKCVCVCAAVIYMCVCVCFSVGVCGHDSCFAVCVYLCGSQMGWICRVGTERLAELQAISANSVITHN